MDCVRQGLWSAGAGKRGRTSDVIVQPDGDAKACEACTSESIQRAEGGRGEGGGAPLLEILGQKTRVFVLLRGDHGFNGSASDRKLPLERRDLHARTPSAAAAAYTHCFLNYRYTALQISLLVTRRAPLCRQHILHITNKRSRRRVFIVVI